MKESLKKIYLHDKKSATISGVIGIVVFVGVMVAVLLLIPIEEEDIWAVVGFCVLVSICLIFMIISLLNGIYINPNNGKILFILGNKIKLFSLGDIKNVQIVFYEQYNGRFLASVSVSFNDGREFVHSYLKSTEVWSARINGSLAITAATRQQVDHVREQLANEAKFTVEEKIVLG